MLGNLFGLWETASAPHDQRGAPLVRVDRGEGGEGPPGRGAAWRRLAWGEPCAKILGRPRFSRICIALVMERARQSMVRGSKQEPYSLQRGQALARLLEPRDEPE